MKTFEKLLYIIQEYQGEFVDISGLFLKFNKVSP